MSNNYYFNGQDGVDFSSWYERRDVMKTRKNFRNTCYVIVSALNFQI